MGMFYVFCVSTTCPPAPPSLEHQERAFSVFGSTTTSPSLPHPFKHQEHARNGAFLVFGILLFHHHVPIPTPLSQTLRMRQKRHIFGVWRPPLPPIPLNIKNAFKMVCFCVRWFSFLAHSLSSPLNPLTHSHSPSLSLSLSSLPPLSSHSLLPLSVSSLCLLSVSPPPPLLSLSPPLSPLFLSLFPSFLLSPPCLYYFYFRYFCFSKFPFLYFSPYVQFYCVYN